IHEVTGGHEEDPIRVQEEPRGHHRTREDTPLRRFGTVRPRVQIPGPRPFSYSKSTISNVVWSQLHTAVSQFPAEQRNRGAVTASVAANVRSGDWESLGWKRPKPADARGRNREAKDSNPELSSTSYQGPGPSYSRHPSHWSG